MKNVEQAPRANFFTNSSKAKAKTNILARSLEKSNNQERKKEIENSTMRDADVKISDAIKDFAKIKKSVDLAPEIDNSEKIARLKKEIASGTYEVNYEALADKILENEL